MKKFIAALLIASYCTVSFGHGGGLDSNGCHRESSTGTSHCHDQNQKSSSAGGSGATFLALAIALGFYWSMDNKREKNQFNVDQESRENLFMTPYVRPDGFGVYLSYKF